MKEEIIFGGRRKFLKKSIAGLAGISLMPPMIKGNYIKAAPQPEKISGIVIRELGNTGVSLPVVSMGVMNSDNSKLVKAALDAGIKHFDTAHAYQRGRNEKMVGEVLKNVPRDSIVIATKIVGGPVDRKTGLFTSDAKATDFLEMFELSLKRLQMDYVDILYLHNVVKRKAALFDEYLGALQKLKKEGKTRFIGVSTHRNEPEVIRAAIESKVYDVVLTAYNFRQPHLKEMNETIAAAATAGLGVIAMKTQAGGYWDRERQHPINMKAALKWALQNKHVHTAIPGFTTFDQLNDDVSVMRNLKLTPREEKDLQLGDKLGMSGLYCRQCGTCVDYCSENLDIPTIMRSYMYAYGYRNLSLAYETLRELDLPADVCNDCQLCIVNCPMGFKVRTKIRDIVRINQVPQEFLT